MSVHACEGSSVHFRHREGVAIRLISHSFTVVAPRRAEEVSCMQNGDDFLLQAIKTDVHLELFYTP